MTNLDNFSNIYATLSQSSYPNRRNMFGEIYNFADLSTEMTKKSKESNNSVLFKFPNAKDAHGNDMSKSYLQLDKLKTNDWVENNSSFTLFNAYIPQAKLATKAMHEKISELRTKAPNATMSITGHSLGTMVSIQAVANLPKKDIAKIDKVVLFQGPDARESIDKMSRQAQLNIQTLVEQGKIEYYINAFDIVSMLNRNKKGVDEIGKVHYLLPKSFTSTFDFDERYGSSHDFGQYQINADGTLKEANLKEHSYIFLAGINVSHMIDKYLGLVAKNTGEKVSSGNLLTLLMSDGELYAKFQQEYQAIISEAKLASQWQERVTNLKKKLIIASGSEKIELREELAQAVADKAKSIGKEYEVILKNTQQEFEDEVASLAKEIINGAYAIRKHLSFEDVSLMIAPYTKENLWNGGQGEKITNRLKYIVLKQKISVKIYRK